MTTLHYEPQSLPVPIYTLVSGDYVITVHCLSEGLLVAYQHTPNKPNDRKLRELVSESQVVSYVDRLLKRGYKLHFPN